MRLEDALLKKSRPKRGSKRFKLLEEALYAKKMDDYGRGIMPTFNVCERCKTMLINPQSILIHQGGFCQSRIAKTNTL